MFNTALYRGFLLLYSNIRAYEKLDGTMDDDEESDDDFDEEGFDG